MVTRLHSACGIRRWLLSPVITQTMGITYLSCRDPATNDRVLRDNNNPFSLFGPFGAHFGHSCSIREQKIEIRRNRNVKFSPNPHSHFVPLAGMPRQAYNFQDPRFLFLLNKVPIPPDVKQPAKTKIVITPGLATFGQFYTRHYLVRALISIPS
jgi:hypothetical protein